MRDESKKRNFVQTIDLVITFKGIDFKKETNKIDLEVKLPYFFGEKESKVLVFVKNKDLAEQLKEKVSKIIMETEIEKLSKKEVQEITDSFDILLAEGPVMLTVAKFLGQQLAPKNKMPKPIQNLKEFENFLTKSGGTIKLSNRKGKIMPVLQANIGKESMKDEELAENILAIYNTLILKIEKKQNIKSFIIKLSMGKPIKIGEDQKPILSQKKEKPVEKKEDVKEEKKEVEKKEEKSLKEKSLEKSATEKTEKKGKPAKKEGESK